MDHFKRSGGFGKDRGEKPRFGRERFDRQDSRRGGGRDRDDQPMFQATCSTCHKPCEVPFRPNGERPVYCKDCFREKNTAITNEYIERGGVPKKYEQHAVQTAPRPAGDPRVDAMKHQIEQIGTKLDTLMRMVADLSKMKQEASTPSVAVVKTTVNKKVATPRTVVAAKNIVKAKSTAKPVAKKKATVKKK